MNSCELMNAMFWLLEEAQCYDGAKWINDPHEAARRITAYFDEMKALNPSKYEQKIKDAIQYGRAMAKT